MPEPKDRPKRVSETTPGIGNLSPEDRKAFQDRVESLDARLDGVQSQRQLADETAQDRAMQSKGMAMGLRMSTELVAAIAVGGLIGYGLDKWLGTSPWLFLVFFMLGFAAGIINVTRAFNRMQADIKRQTGGDIGQDLVDDDEDA